MVTIFRSYNIMNLAPLFQCASHNLDPYQTGLNDPVYNNYPHL
jgi:hypothetical protein